MCDVKGVTISLKVTINKERSKVLFVEAEADFVDVLLSFLTIPLGKLVAVLKKHYGDEAPPIGSFNTLYNGFADLDTAYFLTHEGGKQILLNPKSSLGDQCIKLNLDVADTPLPYYFYSPCGHSYSYSSTTCFISTFGVNPRCARCSLNYDHKSVVTDSRSLRSIGFGVFTKRCVPFIISDDLHILPLLADLNRIISVLGIVDTDGAELRNVSLGFKEIMDLLKLSLFSPTPLSGLILEHKRQIICPAKIPCQIKKYAVSNTTKFINLKVIVQKSSYKLLYARAGEDFVNFLGGLLAIPLGRTVSLLGSGNSLNCINNLYKSVTDLIDNEVFRSPDVRDRLIKLKLAHGSISSDQLLPLAEECYPGVVVYPSDSNFPGKYVKGLRTYNVADDLTVTPDSLSSIISKLNDLNIPVSDITELELKIGEQEALRILEASLTSTSVLSDALIKDLMLKKQAIKQEQY